ncbi:MULTISPECIES: helix-turn-helix domain-containing protein [Marinobacter]|uniref:helix-turn-helix domain-containing protein n=1 Tax=Marinobacter TaxID=2742 RepID=UPI000DACE3EB|nr:MULTISPECIES: AraC family transcriptional regulator [Marinobacter]
MDNKNNLAPVSLRSPKLCLWNREGVFLGTHYARQEPHRTTQERLTLCLNGTFTLRGADGAPITTRSCLTPAGLWLDHSVLDTRKAVVAIFFLPPFSRDYASLGRLMREASPGIYYQHPDEEALIRELIAIRNAPDISPNAARQRLRRRLLPNTPRQADLPGFDARIVRVAHRIRESLGAPCPLAEMAASVHLSGSRLEKLFKKQVGLTITQYRIRYRVSISTILMALGHSMTDAAMYAGFSSSAHLSRCYRTVNGMSPSAMFLQPPYLHPLVDESALELVAPLLGSRVAV